MKWYHFLILASIALAVLAVEQRLANGSAEYLVVLLAVPGIIYLSSKTLEFVFNIRL
jgi:hypothetical protein